MTVDNAKYHYAKIHKLWGMECRSRFVLDYLPAYSPDLNSIKRVWKLVRRLATHNRCFSDLREITAAVEHTLFRWHFGNEGLRRLCAII